MAGTTRLLGEVTASSSVSAGATTLSSLVVTGSTVLSGDVTMLVGGGGLVATGAGDISTTGSGSITTTGTGDIRTVAGNIRCGGELHVGSTAYFGRATVTTGTSTQSTPLLTVRDHADYGGVGAGGTVRMQVGDPTTGGKTILRSAGTASDGMLLDAAGGASMVAGTSLMLSGATSTRVTSGSFRHIAAGSGTWR